jgi:formamidopyrimidine-DNA glycosylase
MPEVVEVRKTVDFLNKIVKNKYLMKISLLKGRYVTHEPFALYNEIIQKLPLKIINIKTKGKFIYFILENNFFIYSTLGLRGGWTFKKKSSNNYSFPKLIDYINDNSLEKYRKISLNNLNVSFEIKDIGTVYYYDSLSFGTLKVIDNREDLDKKLKSIGDDIMEVPISVFKNNIFKRNNLEKEIGNILLNQKIVSGIGNYLRSDILWLSKISPFRKVKDLSDKDIKIIFKNAKLLTLGEYNFSEAIKLNYIKSSDKLPKDYKRNFFAYNSDKDIYGNKVIAEKLYEGKEPRTIYWVPSRQI